MMWAGRGEKVMRGGLLPPGGRGGGRGFEVGWRSSGSSEGGG